MVFRRKPRGRQFFDLFSTAGTNIAASVDVLREFVAAPLDRRPVLAARMHELENAGDDATHAIVDQLNRSFITPFDREDLYLLASRLDDVVDHVDAAVDFANLYGIGEFPEGVADQVDLLGKAARLTADAMPRWPRPPTSRPSGSTSTRWRTRPTRCTASWCRCCSAAGTSRWRS